MSVPFKKTDHLLKFIFGATVILSIVYVVLDLLLSALEALVKLLFSANFPIFK
jgi:hypothetical protein